MRKRSIRVEIYFDEAEYAALIEKVRKSGQSRERYCRNQLKEAVVKEAPTFDTIEMLKELKRIGYNLNEVLKKANSIGLLNVPEMRKVVAEVRQAAKSILDAYTTE